MATEKTLLAKKTCTVDVELSPRQIFKVVEAAIVNLLLVEQCEVRLNDGIDTVLRRLDDQFYNSKTGQLAWSPDLNAEAKTMTVQMGAEDQAATVRKILRSMPEPIFRSMLLSSELFSNGQDVVNSLDEQCQRIQDVSMSKGPGNNEAHQWIFDFMTRLRKHPVIKLGVGKLHDRMQQLAAASDVCRFKTGMGGRPVFHPIQRNH